jgi:glycosyltransferase involved in cell wall biosynthesis
MQSFVNARGAGYGFAGLGLSAAMDHKTSLRQACDEFIGPRGGQMYFDVSCLLEQHWTGIPQVAAGLARALRAGSGNRLRYVFQDTEVQAAAVDDALARDSGVFLRRAVESGEAVGLPVAAENALGIFPSVKPLRRVFAHECSIIHDMSTLTLPQYHTFENIALHMQSMLEDVRSNLVTFCVSQATRLDVENYLGIDGKDVVVAHNGVCWPEAMLLDARNELESDSVEPYVIVLGTREPRKNVLKILEFLAVFPAVLETCRFVFVGKKGWLGEHETIPPVLAEAMAEGRILFTGYVTEQEKCTLLMGARACLYPSLFEGFGLPVIEALSLGTPCIASRSSSIPEVGGEFCTYFDPYSLIELGDAVERVLARNPKGDAAYVAASSAFAQAYSWERMADTMVRETLCRL